MIIRAGKNGECVKMLYANKLHLGYRLVKFD